MSAIVLGPARIGDAPAIADMSRTLIEPGLPWRWTPRRVAAHMKERENLVVIARDGRELVGFAMAQFSTESVHLTLIGVAAHRKRSGIGRRLIAWVEESAVVAGLFQVHLEVRAGNHEARRFYGSLGYRETGCVAGYYSGVEDAIRLSRDLRATLRA
ncbi:MAG TPA: GNAT family N-acetyltransferase [Povalibacter sp.]|nr:GNAT family N-acetyltransferase [Povalibacter sp.]